MTMTYGSRAQLSRYNSDAVMSATPVRLLTMLYDRLLLDLARAETAQGAEMWDIASENLTHAQAIVAELESSLDVTVWDGGQGLLALYGFVADTLVGANIYRDQVRTRQAIELLEPLRLAWHEAAQSLPAAPARIGAGMVGVG